MKMVTCRDWDPLRSVWTGGDPIPYNAGTLLSIKFFFLNNNTPTLLRIESPSVQTNWRESFSDL
jgi:hypothetical protein